MCAINWATRVTDRSQASQTDTTCAKIGTVTYKLRCERRYRSQPALPLQEEEYNQSFASLKTSDADVSTDKNMDLIYRSHYVPTKSAARCLLGAVTRHDEPVRYHVCMAHRTAAVAHRTGEH